MPINMNINITTSSTRTCHVIILMFESNALLYCTLCGFLFVAVRCSFTAFNFKFGGDERVRGCLAESREGEGGGLVRVS